MLAQFLSLVIVNTYSWFGGQGYCSYDFALRESEAAYSSVKIVLRPQFDPENTATGNTELDDQTIALDTIGGASVDQDQIAKVETDCNVTGFDIIRATAEEDGRIVNLLEKKRITIDTYKPLPITVNGN